MLYDKMNEIFELMNRALLIQDTETKNNILMGICVISENSVETVMKFFNIYQIINILSENNNNLIKIIVQIIGALSLGKPENFEILFKTNFLIIFKEILEKTENLEIKKLILWVISNISATNYKQISYLIDSKILFQIFFIFKNYLSEILVFFAFYKKKRYKKKFIG